MERAELLALLERAKAGGWTELDLSGSGLQELPAAIGQLQDLVSLNLFNNKLSQLPQEIAQLQSLSSLDLGKNQFNQLPLEVTHLQKLHHLYLWYNQLSSLPEEFKNLKSLNWLYLNHNQFSHFPLEITNLSNLTDLDMGFNQLEHVPMEIGRLHKLQELYLNGNEIISLSSGIGQLKKLVILVLSGNKLIRLPSEIGELWSLTQLYLGENCLSDLPPEFGNIRNLMMLWLNNNKLSRLPRLLQKLSCLREIHLEGNPLRVSQTMLEKIGVLSQSSDSETVLDFYFSNQDPRTTLLEKLQDFLEEQENEDLIQLIQEEERVISSSFNEEKCKDGSSFQPARIQVCIADDQEKRTTVKLDLVINKTNNFFTVNNYHPPQTPEAAQQAIQELLKQLKINEETTAAKLQTQVTIQDLDWQRTLWAAFKNAGPELAKSAVAIALASAGLPGAIAAAVFNVVLEGVRGGLEARKALPPGEDNPFGTPTF